MRTTRLLFAATATVALALPLAACSGDAGGSGLTWEDSPLAEYWNAGYDPSITEEEQQAQFEAQNVKREELIAQCMVDEGFEYKPQDTSGYSISFGTEVEWEPDKKEWVEKYGYGIINNPWNEQEQEQEPMPEPTEWVDPNQDYLDSLSESEQVAYYEALYGAPIEYEEGDEDTYYEYDWTKSGCQGYADHEVNGDNQDIWSEYEDLTTRMGEIYTKVEESPELAELDAKWSSCMADAGFDIDKQANAQEVFYEEVNKLYESFTEEDWASGDPLRTHPDAAALGEREIKTALADLECRNKTNYSDTRMKLQFSYEEQFVKENKAELDEFKAAQEQAVKG